MVLVSKISLKEIKMSLESTIRKMYLPEEDIDKEMQVILEETDFDEIIESIMAEEVELEEKWRVTNKDLGVWTGEAKSEKDAKEKAMRKWGVRKSQASSPMFMKNTEAVKEEVEIDEDGEDRMKKRNKAHALDKERDHEFAMKWGKKKEEDVEIDEGRMKELHGYIEKGMSAEDIAKKMKLDVKTIKSLMDEGIGDTILALAKSKVKAFTSLGKKNKGEKTSSEPNPLAGVAEAKDDEDEDEDEKETDKKAKKDDAKKTGKEKIEINPTVSEARRSASQQARRDAGSTFKDKDDEEDDVATDADKKRADLNIIMQLKKAADNPRHKVKFDDGKAVVIKPAVVKGILQTFAKLKSNDKQKIQPEMAKSYKNMVAVMGKLIRKAGYNENIEESQMDKVTMERMGISPDLVSAVKDVLAGKRPVEEKSGDAAAYKKFFDSVLKKFKVGSPSELDDDQKKKFYDYIDKNWTSDAEKAGKDEEVEHDLDLIEMNDEDIDVFLESLTEEELDIIIESDELAESPFTNLLKKAGKGIAKRATKTGRLGVKADKIDKKAAKVERKKEAKEKLKRAQERLKKAKQAASEEVEVDEGSISKAAKKAFVKRVSGESVDEKEMSDAQMEKREEIVKELKKKTEDFKKKYGDRWEDVMYATATKLAMK